ncbi:hypothetical protein [uncultured Nostoc sp.]|uniref:hypothetical protein n=1 Tax=uncultured Nostoc sp. TaxID=340711 RepID=UPI0035C95D23|nr:hypothetical protein [Nostoc sp. JL33]
MSLIGALNLDGLVAAMTVPGSTNTGVFLTYVTEILIPQLWKGAMPAVFSLPSWSWITSRLITPNV